MNTLFRSLVPLFLISVIGILPGCAPSNESQANITGEEAKGVGGAPPPKTQEEYMRQQRQAGGGNPYAGQGYPGAN